MKENFKYIGENVRRARQNRSLTLEQLSELVGISDSFLGVAERGTSGFSVETIIGIAKVLGISTDSLLLENRPVEPEPSSKLETILTLLKNSNDAEIDFYVDYIKFCRNKGIFKSKE